MGAALPRRFRGGEGKLGRRGSLIRALRLWLIWLLERLFWYGVCKGG